MTTYVTAYPEVSGNEHEYLFGVVTPLEYREVYWSDTGFEHEITQEPELLFLEAVDHEGEPYEPTKKQIDIAYDMAYELYYTQEGFRT